MIVLMYRITSAHGGVILIFDRGYGKIGFLDANTKKNFHMLTIEITVRSRHTFILMEESVKYINNCKKKNETDNVIENKVDVYSSWVISEQKM